MNRAQLVDELLAERYGPAPRRAPRVVDDQAVIAERQRVLCEALDPPHQPHLYLIHPMHHAA